MGERQVVVNGRAVMVPEDATPEEVARRAGVPDGRRLAALNPEGGNALLAPGQPVDRDVDSFMDIPTFRYGAAAAPALGARLRLQRIEREVLALATQYGAVDWDSRGGSWFMVRQIPLPRPLRRQASPLLVLLPDGYPQVPPPQSNFFLDKGLGIPSHYHETGHGLAGQGWAWFCVTVDGWRATNDIWSGDHLVKLVEATIASINGIVRGA